MAAGFKSATVNAASVPSTQTNFPAYVDLSRVGVTTLAEAQSVRVYADSAKTTEWAREIVSATEMHVKVPSLTSTVVMYVDWDGVRADYAVTDTYGRNNVWSAYRAVWHMDGLTNSQGNSIYNLTNRNTVTFGAGKIGNAADSGASNTTKTLDTGTTEVLNETEHQSNWTHSFWMNARSVAAAITMSRSYAAASGGKKMMQFNYSPTGGEGIWFFWVGSTLGFYYSGDAISVDTWYKLDYVLGTSGALNIYLNNSLILSTTVTSFATRGDTDGSAYRWGYFGDRTSSLYNPMSGYIDEARVITTPLSSDWRTTEYNNQNDEATFWGTWTTVGGGSPTPLLSLMGVGS